MPNEAPAFDFAGDEQPSPAAAAGEQLAEQNLIDLTPEQVETAARLLAAARPDTKTEEVA